MTHNEIVNVFDRLGQLEDAAKQRKKGCCFCENKVNLGCYQIKYISNVPCIASDGQRLFNIIYCPACGKKLV